MPQPPYGPPQPPPPGWRPPAGPNYSPYGPPPPKKSMSAGAIVAIVLGSIVGAIVLIGVLGAAIGNDDNAKPRATPAAPTTAKGTPPAKKNATSNPKPAGYVDGDYIIGEDIPPGTYQTPGAQAGAFEFCMVSTKPTVDGIMPQLKSANANERIIITLTAKDGVLSIAGCEPLTRRK